MGHVSSIQASTGPLNSLPPRLYADLVGKPFEKGGRGPSAYDCLGLVIEVVRRNGFAVPDYTSSADELARQASADGGVLGPCYRIERADSGCVVLMRSPSRTAQRHLGVMVDRWHMLHASQDAGQVVKESLGRSLWGRRVLGFYFPESRP